jgi:formiminoglutamase
MFNHWVLPVSQAIIDAAKVGPQGMLGHNVTFVQSDKQKLPKGAVLIIGLDAIIADQIRSSLFHLVSPSERLRIIDLGNFRKSDANFCIPFIQELLTAGHLVLMLGNTLDTALTQFLSYRDFKRVSNMALIDNQLYLATKEESGDFGSEFQQILMPRHKRLFHFALIGSQAHFMSPAVVKYFSKKHFEHIRLGLVRNEINSVEPAIRDMDLVSANLRVLRHADTPGAASGLTVEEFCQIGRYAGMAEKVTSLSITCPTSIFHIGSAAQFIWYFLEGFGQRHNDFPVSVTEMTEYIVTLEKLNHQLTFWRSNKSGRWWVQVPVLIEKNKDRHRLVPCTYQDYQLATKEELSDRLVRAFDRFL